MRSCAAGAGRTPEPRRRAVADTPASSCSCSRPTAEPISSSTSRPRRQWAAYRFRRLSRGHGATLAIARRRRSCASRPSRFDVLDADGRPCRAADRRRRDGPLRGDRGDGRHQILLGARPSARRSPISTIRLALRSNSRQPSGAMKFGIDRLLADPELREPLEGKRVALLAHPASVTADLTQPRRAGRGGPQRLRGVRAAARPARRQAGQYDGIAGLYRSDLRHAGVQPLRRGAAADRPVDGHVRRASWSTCRTSAAASTPSSPPCSTCSRPRRSTARRSGCSTGPIPPAARSRG